MAIHSLRSMNRNINDHTLTWVEKEEEAPKKAIFLSERSFTGGGCLMVAVLAIAVVAIAILIYVM